MAALPFSLKPLRRERRYLEARMVPLSCERCYLEDRTVPLCRERCYLEDAHWHEQAQRYSDFVSMAHDKRLLLLEFGVGFNTPVIIRFPFEQMAAQFPDTTLVRFNRDYPQLSTQGISRYVAFTEGVEQIFQQSAPISTPDSRGGDETEE